jgi:aminoglycoside phosphotransferase (APT) family kinase protein
MAADTDPELIAQLRDRATAAAQSWVPGAKVVEVKPLTGGTSSLTFIAELEGVPEDQRRMVLKVAPPGLAPVRNRDVIRQGKLMNALYGRPGVLVPPVFFSDPGAPVEISPFVAMGFVAGECVEPNMAPESERTPERRAEVLSRAYDAGTMLAAIHALDPTEIGLGDEPVVPLSEEIDRWTRALRTVPEDLQGDYERVAEALHDTMPPAMTPVVNHGDYRLGNTMCVGGKLTAVIDWEIWSVGDPRVDATWLTFFCDDQKHPGGTQTDVPSGMPTTRELLDHYIAARGSGLPDMNWFEALTRYKETSATALLIKRYRKTGGQDSMLKNMTPALPGMLNDALALIGR